jgi:hypothetical protein
MIGPVAAQARSDGPREPIPGGRPDVFVCYASGDEAAADAVVAVLEQDGIRCWVSPRDVIPGHGYGEDIVAAIHASRIVVLLLSARANDSQTVMRELERAVSGGLPIVPLRLEPVTPSGELTYYLTDAHWLDAITPPLEQHVHDLADSIKVLLARADADRRTMAEADTGAQPGPGWFQDPLGRHEHRYWNGARWTAQVSDGGRIGADPAVVEPSGRGPGAGPVRGSGLRTSTLVALAVTAAVVVAAVVVLLTRGG